MNATAESASELELEKRRLRRRMSASLRSIAGDAALEKGRHACLRLLDWERFDDVTEWVAYSALPGEIDPGPICEFVRSKGKEVLLPRMVGPELEFAAAGPEEVLVSGRYGVLEPGADRAARLVEPGAAVLVPGVAFDRFGGRLGRGAGYYDRALSAMRRRSESIVFIGLAFSRQIVERVPMTSEDVVMDGVLTEDALGWREMDASDRPRPR